MEENKPNKGIKSYIYYIVILVVVLIITIVTFSYAYFDAVDKENDSATVNIGGKTACISVTLNGEPVKSLTYNYPITDDFAVGETPNVTPIEVTIKNTCTDGEAIDYSVILTALSNGDNNYISPENIKIKVSKENSSENNDFINTQLLNGVSKLNENSTTKNLLEKKLNEFDGGTYETYTKNFYVIDTGKIEANATITYKTYLWISYEATTDIQAKKFDSIVSVVVNNPEDNLKATN